MSTVQDQSPQKRLSRRSRQAQTVANKYSKLAPAKETPKPRESKDPFDFSSDSSLSEEEQIVEQLKVRPKKKQVSSTKEIQAKRRRFADTIPKTFPLRVKKEDIKIHKTPIVDTETIAREITFVAKYNRLNIICVAIIPAKRPCTDQTDLVEPRNEYEWEMSNTLSICRNMATYIDYFIMSPGEMNVKYLKDLPNHPARFFIKPYYEYGTLRAYLNGKAKKGLVIEPYYLLHMAITLFTALTDAHSQDIALVDLTQDAFLVGMDGGLYFTKFRSCIDLNERSYPPWIPLDAVICPGSKLKYSKETDVFCASNLLLELIQKSSKEEPKLYIQNKKLKSIHIIEDNVNPIYDSLLPIIEQGLRYNGANRPTAEVMLNCFQKMRAKALGIQCGL